MLEVDPEQNSACNRAPFRVRFGAAVEGSKYSVELKTFHGYKGFMADKKTKAEGKVLYPGIVLRGDNILLQPTRTAIALSLLKQPKIILKTDDCSKKDTKNPFLRDQSR